METRHVDIMLSLHSATVLILSGMSFLFATDPDIQPGITSTGKIQDNTLVIGLMGDVMIGRTVDPMIRQEGSRYPWGDMLPLLQHTDVNIINLETTLTNSKRRVEKVFNFRSAPENVPALQEANVSLASLANNHILDYSEEGLSETLRTLKKAGIRYAGAGLNEQEACTGVVIEKKQFRIGLVSFTDNEPGWKAGPHQPDINYINIASEADRQRALDTIARLRRDADIIVVSIHWGPNMREEPSPLFIEFAHQMIDRGADIIHGHSAHIFQGIEVYRNKLICYDTGDFVDDYAVDPILKNNHSFFYKITAGKQGIQKLELVPVLISHYQVNQASGESYRWCMNRVRQLSARFGTVISDAGVIQLEKTPGH